MAYYLYALCYKDAVPDPSSSWPPGVNPDEKLSYISSGSLTALVQEVDLSEFDTGALAQNLQRTDWLEAKVRAHDEIIRRLFEEVDAVVPVRFCTVFKTGEGVKSALDRWSKTILADLERLRGAAEWGIKVYANEKKCLETAEQASGESRKLSSGIEYLRRKQRQEKLARQVREWIREQVNDCHQTLIRLSRGYRVNPCEGNDDDERMALNSVYLVDRSRKQEWLEELERFASRWAGSGLRLVVSGPWPPYSFVTPVVEQDEPDE
ncbi:MAG: GvpL/GvpF family gas vesicle protein [Bacillota bacterium]